MEQKVSLLEQLRIERTPESPAGKGRGRAGRVGLITVIAVVVLAAAAAAYWKVSQADTTAVQAVTARALAGAGAAGAAGGASAAPGASLLDASGYVVALREATVSSQLLDRVDDVLVQAGEQVKKGQIIAKLDDGPLRASLAQSLAQVVAARASLEQAELATKDAEPTYERQVKELAAGLISQDTFDTTKASYDSARAAVSVAQGNLDAAQATVVVNQRNLEYTIIRAPFDGVVTAKDAQPGQIVSYSFSSGGGIADIVDMNSLEVDVDVSENYISRVHPQQPATITLDAYPDDHMPAHVIAIIPTADKSKATVQVRVAFEHRDPRVLPQMGARVSFLADTSAAGASSAEGSSASASASAASAAADTPVLVPADAVETNSDGNSGTVFVIDGKVVHAHSVRLGARGSDGQLVLSGLDAGALVAVGDLSKLRDGLRVRITQ